MQSLDVISVNIWHILISLANLAILFFVVKRFLFAPVRKMVSSRESAIESRVEAANEAQKAAEANKEAWEEKLRSADAEADSIIKDASDAAKRRADQIVENAREKADGIVARAEEEAELERKKADEDIKREIVDVSAALAEKMLEREVKAEDHRAMIDGFIKNIGDENE
jgi:F-type H+-transporting ATPase subunit b